MSATENRGTVAELGADPDLNKNLAHTLFHCSKPIHNQKH